VQEEDLSGHDGSAFVALQKAWLRNYTDFSAENIQDILATKMKMRLEYTREPQVLIVHTHATESYNPTDAEVYDKRYNWRSTDNNNNVVAVGAVLADTLRAQGIGVIQDTTQHVYPSYDGSYERSYQTVKKYLDAYPSIKVVFDVHRDAIERDGGVVVKPTTRVDGKKAAQLMIISNCDDGSGTIPNGGKPALCGGDCRPD
jgi:stage II sporulation protein P